MDERAEHASVVSVEGASAYDRIRAALRHDSAFWRRLAFAGAAKFPEWWRRGTPRWFGTAFWAALPNVRRVVESNQARILGVGANSLAARRAAHRVFVQYAECLTDGLELAGRPNRPFAHRVVGREHLDRALERGRGAILATAHTGNWEVGASCFASDRSLRVTMVMAAERDASARAYVAGLRHAAGADVVYADGADPAAALTLLARLRRGEAVAIQIDRLAAGTHGIATRLFGASFVMPAGPLRLAQAARAPIVPVFTWRTGYRAYEIEMGPAIDVGQDRRSDAVGTGAQTLAHALQRFISMHPDQWFHFSPMESV